MERGLSVQVQTPHLDVVGVRGLVVWGGHPNPDDVDGRFEIYLESFQRLVGIGEFTVAPIEEPEAGSVITYRCYRYALHAHFGAVACLKGIIGRGQGAGADGQVAQQRVAEGKAKPGYIADVDSPQASGDASGQLVIAEIERYELGQVAQFRRDLTGEPVELETNVQEFCEVTDLSRLYSSCRSFRFARAPIHVGIAPVSSFPRRSSRTMSSRSPIQAGIGLVNLLSAQIQKL